MIDLIVQGHSVAKACRKVKLSNSTLYATMKRYKWIKDAYDIAQEQACDALESALLDIDTDPVYESDDPGKQRVTSNNIKWILARKNRVRFGNQTAARRGGERAESREDRLGAATSEKALQPARAIGGRGRIRAEPAGRCRSAVFKTAAFIYSATPPCLNYAILVQGNCQPLQGALQALEDRPVKVRIGRGVGTPVPLFGT